MKRNLPTLRLILFGLMSLLSAGQVAVCRADVLNYSVSFDTAQLPAPTTGYNLDFLLVNGSGTANNQQSVLANNFDFDTGSATAGTTFSRSGGSGNATSGFTLTDSAFRNEVGQGFTRGSDLFFNLRLTTGAASTTSPDVFSFYLFDGTSASRNYVLTNDPTGANALFTVNFDSLSNPTITSYTTTPTFGSQTPTVQAVPEPATWLMVMLGLIALGLWRRRNPTSQRAWASL